MGGWAKKKKRNKRKEKERKKSKRNYRTSQNIRRINVFLESLSLTGSHSPPYLHNMPSNTGLWTYCGGILDSHLVLLLCVLASYVHNYQ